MRKTFAKNADHVEVFALHYICSRNEYLCFITSQVLAHLHSQPYSGHSAFAPFIWLRADRKLNRHLQLKHIVISRSYSRENSTKSLIHSIWLFVFFKITLSIRFEIIRQRYSVDKCVIDLLYCWLGAIVYRWATSGSRANYCPQKSFIWLTKLFKSLVLV